MVSQFDAIANNANLPTEISSRLPAVQWFAASVNVNGGVNGVLRAETRDDQSADQLRDIIRGGLAAARLVSGNDPKADALVNSLQVMGTGRNVSVSFTLPAEIIEMIHGVAGLRPQHRAATNRSRPVASNAESRPRRLRARERAGAIPPVSAFSAADMIGRLMRIAVIPGDGIGKDVIAEAVKVLTAVSQRTGRALDLHGLPWGADHFLATGETMPADGYRRLRDDYAAILLGAMGDPRVPDNRHARDILLGTRFELDLYVNYRPVALLADRLCPLKDRGRADVNFVVFRENTEGMYVGVGGRFKPGTPDEIAVQEEINTYKGVHRIIRHAFEFARARGLTKVCMADKSNAMAQGHALWQRVFREVAADYPDVEASHLFIDALAMFLVKDPGQFQVIVTNNLFGDIVTDIGGALQGGLGMAASGNIHPGRTSLFEPVHGSAPPLAGKNLANPMGAILSAALMLETLGRADEAQLIGQAVEAAVHEGQTTADIGGAPRHSGGRRLDRASR